jgi:hypothetical protein
MCAPTWSTGFFPDEVQAGIDLTLYFIFFFPGVIALVYSGYALRRLPGPWASAVPSAPSAAPLSLQVADSHLRPSSCLQGIAEIIRCIMALRNGKWPSGFTTSKEIGEGAVAASGKPPKGSRFMSNPELGILMLASSSSPSCSDFPLPSRSSRWPSDLRLFRHRRHHLPAAGAAHLRRHVQRCADRRPVVPVHGLHGGAGEHPGPAVLPTACNLARAVCPPRWPWRA